MQIYIFYLRISQMKFDLELNSGINQNKAQIILGKKRNRMHHLHLRTQMFSKLVLYQIL